MTTENRSFLGQGWHFPPTFTQGGAELECVADTEDIQQSLHIILSTGLGERIMQSHFGCDLQQMLFEVIDQSLINRIRQEISDAIIYHEPRVQLEQVDVSVDEKVDGLLQIRMIYTIRSTNSRFNRVFPFYLYENHTEVADLNAL